jgi:hypothetical protein
VACILVLVAFIVANYFILGRDHLKQVDQIDSHHILEEDNNAYLAPHGVPSGLARDLSSNRLKDLEGM